MEKAKVTMRNWEPYVYDGEYNLSGTADVHPRLGRNVYVATTSTLVKASLEEDVLIYETRNTVYHCPLKYMMVSPYGNVVQEYREELARLDTSENALDRIIAAAAKMSLGEPEDTADEMVRKIRALQETGQQESVSRRIITARRMRVCSPPESEAKGWRRWAGEICRPLATLARRVSQL